MSYSSEVLADSPLLYWRLGEASGTTAADASGNGRTGTYSGSYTLGAASLIVSDTANSAVTLSSNAVASRTDATLDVSSLTVEAWIKPSSTSSTRTIASKAAGTAGSQSWWLRIDNSSASFQVYYGSSTAQTIGGGSIVPGSAYHVVATHNGSTLRLYVNGVEVASDVASGPIYYPSTVRALSVGGSGFVGDSDEFAVYGSALSATRIAAHYNAATTAGPAPITGALSASLPGLSANLAGGIEFTGTLSATLPALGADLTGSYLAPVTGTLAASLPGLSAGLVGESYPPGIAGDLTALLPPLGGSLAGAYSDTATLAAILPPLSANLAGTYAPPPVTGTLSATLPSLAANLAGTAYEPGMTGTLNALLPALTASLSGDVLGRTGLGLALDSSAVLTVDAVLEPEPSVPPGTPSTALHIVAPTVPVPTLVAGRPS